MRLCILFMGILLANVSYAKQYLFFTGGTGGRVNAGNVSIEWGGVEPVIDTTKNPSDTTEVIFGLRASIAFIRNAPDYLDYPCPHPDDQTLWAFRLRGDREGMR